MTRRDAAESFQVFAAALGNLAGDEARKAKLLYVRNELAEYENDLEDSRTFGWLQLAFAVIPIFWPILLAQRRAMVSSAKLAYQRVKNALDVWRDDLGGEAAPLLAELERLHGRAPRLLPWGKRG